MNVNYLKSLTSLFIILFSFTANAQYLEGYATSNYAGINALQYNPASAVDSRIKLDINFLTASITAYNDYMFISTQNLKPRDPDVLNTAGFLNNINSKNLFLGVEALGPGFMLTLDPKQSISFATSFRSITNMDNVSPELAGLYFGQDSWTSLNVDQENLNINSATWNEYAFGYGRELLLKKSHWVSGGIRLKYLQGLKSAHAYAKELMIDVNPDSTLNVNGTNTNFGVSDNGGETTLKLMSNFGNTGFAFDIGFNYEWRPNSDSLPYEMDGKKNPARELSKHKLRIGFALTDVGYINYKANNNTGTVDPINPNWDIMGANLSTINAVNQSISNSFSLLDNQEAFAVYLPMAMQFQVDYNIYKGFYANFTAFKAFNFSDEYNQVHYHDRYTLTPRWDWKWLGAYLPLTYREMTGFHPGLNIMLGPFLIGTQDITTWLGKDENFLANVHFGVKVTSLHFRPEDRDNDKVSDALDECADLPGIWAFQGCPDRDGDSIPDAQDKCPDIPGLKQFRGCPDTDGDGIMDLQDECPSIKGVKKLNGCPDRDGDGIKDSEDECPDEIGLAEYKGCPDFDGDSIIDKLDSCPKFAGPRSEQGCPDTDKDGLYDHKDSCVTTPGPIENKGCPYGDNDGDGLNNKKDKCPNEAGPLTNDGCPLADTDGDGVLDENDECPKTPGIVENDGCPELEEEEEAILNLAFESLEFETGESVIKLESYGSLDTLASLLNEKAKWGLKLAGHTDNVGDAQENLKLSRDRSEAVRTYLINKGVSNPIAVEFFGETKPIESNDNAEGRQKNRRVEMEIVFE